jgi:hypothetical protein
MENGKWAATEFVLCGGVSAAAAEPTAGGAAKPCGVLVPDNAADRGQRCGMEANAAGEGGASEPGPAESDGSAAREVSEATEERLNPKAKMKK